LRRFGDEIIYRPNVDFFFFYKKSFVTLLPYYMYGLLWDVGVYVIEDDL